MRLLSQASWSRSNKTLANGYWSALTPQGVHYGRLYRRDGAEVILTAARRIWRWEGHSLSCSEVATVGADGGKIAVRLPWILLIGAIEIIPMTAAARVALDLIGDGL